MSFPDAVLALTRGWTALDGDTGCCPECSHHAIERRHPVARASAEREQQSMRAVTISRARVQRSRQSRWDEQVVEATARRLKFVPVRCRACQSTGDDRCPNCEGEGEVWRNGAATLSRGGLLRLATVV